MDSKLCLLFLLFLMFVIRSSGHANIGNISNNFDDKWDSFFDYRNKTTDSFSTNPTTTINSTIDDPSTRTMDSTTDGSNLNAMNLTTSEGSNPSTMNFTILKDSNYSTINSTTSENSIISDFFGYLFSGDFLNSSNATNGTTINNATNSSTTVSSPTGSSTKSNLLHLPKKSVTVEDSGDSETTAFPPLNTTNGGLNTTSVLKDIRSNTTDVEFTKSKSGFFHIVAYYISPWYALLVVICLVVFIYRLKHSAQFDISHQK